MTRREARALVTSSGGVPVDNDTRRTSVLVVGMAGWPLLQDGTISRKLQRAETLNRGGAAIRIIAEEEFLELAGRAERVSRLDKAYPASHVCELLGLDAETLRRWELFGLIRSHDGLYDFQDIVSLRTIADLVGRGVDPGTIGSSMRGLAAVLPGTDRPLSQLKIVIEQPRSLLAELGELLVGPDGQMLLNFAPTAAAPAPAAVTDPSTAQAWFEQGGMLEEDERLTEAADAYRQALAMRPDFPDARFNLGNTMRGLGLIDEAEHQYRLAVKADPAMAVAWYNLADLLEEAVQLDQAAACLERALSASPAYADAHFNLAWCCERLGQIPRARKHWTAYLGLDSAGEWADVAREHLAAPRVTSS